MTERPQKDTVQKDGEIVSRLSVARDPAWTEIPSPSFQRHAHSTENSLLTASLRTEAGVRAMRTYLRHVPQLSSPPTVPTGSTDGDSSRGQREPPAVAEVCVVFSLGSGVNGIKDTCHGSVISLMLDETTGQLATEVFGRYNIVTAGLSVSYKRRLGTPCVVLCKAWITKSGDRAGGADVTTVVRGGNASQKRDTRPRKKRIEAEGRIEDQEGRVFATGKATFVRIETKL